MSLILGANQLTAGGYEVDNSLRFNSGSTDYLSRTPSTTTNRRTWTWSSWVKKSVISSTQVLFTAYTSNTDSGYLFARIDNGTGVIRIASGTNSINFITTPVYRDVSAWYHVVFAVDTTQATSTNRVKIYINGNQVTDFSTGTYPSQNFDSAINGNWSHNIGRDAQDGSGLLNGYLSDVYLIDGQQLTPSSFGEFDSDTNIWKPIPYTGTYGTNGFYLEFKDSSALGDDTSGNSNDWTVNNLTSIDQTTDTPTNNFATINTLNLTSSVTFENGNLTFTNTSSGHRMVVGTIGVSTGKWYAEVLVNTLGGTFPQIGILDVTQWTQDSQPGANSRGWGYLSSGAVFNNNSSIDTGEATYTSSDIISIAMDLDNNKLYFAKNGVYINSGVPTSGATGTGAYSITSGFTYTFSSSSYDDTTDPVYSWNFGNPPFTISSGNADANGYGNFEYSVPSGYYALNTKNLAEYG